MSQIGVRLCGVLVLLVSLAGSAHALPFTSLVTVGDSLADSGNNAWVVDNVLDMPGVRTPVPIPSPAFTAEFPYASGRYSNGPVWVEQFADMLGLAAEPSLAGGTNFAFGGARTGPSGSDFPFSLRDQTAMFLATADGAAPSDALYVVQGGGNDARDAFALAAGGGDPSGAIAEYAQNIGAIVMDLADAGARTLMLANTPDIGLIPSTLLLGADVSALATIVAIEMNAALGAVLSTLVLPADFDLVILDLFGLLNQVHADPAAFGLADATSTCGFDPACIADPATTFFWDAIHPTTAGHRVLAERAFAALGLPPTTVPEPASVALLAVAALAGLASRRAARPSA